MYTAMRKEKNGNLKKKETMDLHILTTRLSDYMVLLRHVHLSLSKEKNGNLKKRETMDSLQGSELLVGVTDPNQK